MKLHIGCGQKYLPGYKHVDVLDAKHVDYVCDATNLSMIEDESISEIYACHILEHVRRDDVPAILREWCRVMATGGEIRIAVPDFEAVAAEYKSNTDVAKLQGLLYGGQDNEYNFHYAAYDFDYLKALLEAGGFSDVRRYDWRDFLPLGYDDFSRAYLPHMDFDNGRHMSLNLLARK